MDMTLSARQLANKEVTHPAVARLGDEVVASAKLTRLSWKRAGAMQRIRGSPINHKMFAIASRQVLHSSLQPASVCALHCIPQVTSKRLGL